MRTSLVRIGAPVLTALAVAACSSGGDGSSGGGGGGNLTIDLRGGNGAAGSGGDGGYFDVEGGAGADVKILDSGTVNTEVSLPIRLPYLGRNPQDVTIDTTLVVTTSGLRLSAEDTNLRNAEGVVTGLRVRPGVTLTIHPNYDTGDQDGDNSGWTGTREQVRLGLSDGIIVEGTIKIATRDSAVPGDGGSPETANVNLLTPGGLFVAASGKIDLTGADNAAGQGGMGGYLYVMPDSFHNAGLITTRGGNGSTAGGAGGYVYVHAEHGYAVSTGAITTDGGVGAGGAGGAAGYIDLATPAYRDGTLDWGYIVAKGLFSATGGAGASGGGAGGRIQIFSGGGATIAAGTFRTFGGNATVDGPGGAGGLVNVEVLGPVRVAGSIDTHGGSGHAAGFGGSGGHVVLFAQDAVTASGNSQDRNFQPDSATITFGASVDTRGGAGATGGNAGHFDVSNYLAVAATVRGSPLELVGYSRIDTSGGNGQTSGGDAGWGYVAAGCGWDGDSSCYAGGVSNTANFVLRGGDGATAQGGAGSDLTMETETDSNAPYDFGTTNSGMIDARGGKGATSGGRAGSVDLYGKFFLRNSGTILASGGEGVTDSGGAPGFIELYSDVSLTSTGALTCDGGRSSAAEASTGGEVFISAPATVSVTGSVSARGGSSASGLAGHGGSIHVLSQGDPSQVGAPLSVAKGEGPGPARDGEIWIDGTQISGG